MKMENERLKEIEKEIGELLSKIQVLEAEEEVIKNEAKDSVLKNLLEGYYVKVNNFQGNTTIFKPRKINDRGLLEGELIYFCNTPGKNNLSWNESEELTQEYVSDLNRIDKELYEKLRTIAIDMLLWHDEK